VAKFLSNNLFAIHILLL